MIEKAIVFYGKISEPGCPVGPEPQETRKPDSTRVRKVKNTGLKTRHHKSNGNGTGLKPSHYEGNYKGKYNGKCNGKYNGKYNGKCNGKCKKPIRRGWNWWCCYDASSTSTGYSK